MAHSDARAWWADVEHLRDAYERTDEARRRADLADLAGRRSARERSHATDDIARAVVNRERPPAPSRPAAPPRRDPHAKGTPIPSRRTVEIRGRPVPAPSVPRVPETTDRRRPPRRPVERVGPRPDRMAMWALLMGILLILVAIGTADASVLAR
jgi:hypothetical protein